METADGLRAMAYLQYREIYFLKLFRALDLEPRNFEPRT